MSCTHEGAYTSAQVRDESNRQQQRLVAAILATAQVAAKFGPVAGIIIGALAYVFPTSGSIVAFSLTA